MTPPEQGPLPPEVTEAIDAYGNARANWSAWAIKNVPHSGVGLAAIDFSQLDRRSSELAADMRAARTTLELAIREALAPAQPAGDQEAAHRAWALERVRRREEPKCSKHGDDLIVGTEAGCPECWRILGRREGQMEAGAYYTLDEAMAMLRLGAPTDSGGSATSTDGNPAANALSVSPTPEQKDGTP